MSPRPPMVDETDAIWLKQQLLSKGKGIDLSVIAQEYARMSTGPALNPFWSSQVRMPAPGSVAEREMQGDAKTVFDISTRLLKAQKANTDAVEQVKINGEEQAYEAYTLATRRVINKERRAELLSQASDMARNPKYSAEERSLGRRAQSLIFDIDPDDPKAVLSFAQLLVMTELYDKQQKAKASRAGSEEARLAGDVKRFKFENEGLVRGAAKSDDSSPVASDTAVTQ